MEEQIEFAELFTDGLEDAGDLFIAGDIAGRINVSSPKVPASSATLSLSRSPW
jgi:hypothetical protein